MCTASTPRPASWGLESLRNGTHGNQSQPTAPSILPIQIPKPHGVKLVPVGVMVYRPWKDVRTWVEDVAHIGQCELTHRAAQEHRRQPRTRMVGCRDKDMFSPMYLTGDIRKNLRYPASSAGNNHPNKRAYAISKRWISLLSINLPVWTHHAA